MSARKMYAGSWLLADVPQTYAPAMSLNVTSGQIRSVSLKHGSCAVPAEDVDGSECRGCAELTE